MVPCLVKEEKHQHSWVTVNGMRIIGDKYEEVDREDAEGPGKLWE